jgi:hypothetical protein
VTEFAVDDAPPECRLCGPRLRTHGDGQLGCQQGSGQGASSGGAEQRDAGDHGTRLRDRMASQVIGVAGAVPVSSPPIARLRTECSMGPCQGLVQALLVQEPPKSVVPSLGLSEWGRGGRHGS